MRENQIIKSVSFNLNNDDDTAILKATKRRNFSGYVKGLILADLASKNAGEGEIEAVPINEESKEPPKPMSAAERLQALRLNGKR